MAVVERFTILILVLAGLIWILRYHFNKEERKFTFRFFMRALLCIVIAILITIPFFFLNSLSGL